LIQAMKRSPVNLRPIFLVPKGQNPKSLVLFSSGLFKLSNLGLVADREAPLPLLNRLIDLRSPEKSYFCWGYNFNWQSRGFLLPKFEPNIICTTFAGNALLDGYEKYRNDSYLEMALSAGQFILKGLNITENSDGICFSYTPLDHGQVHNANLLGAALLSRLYSVTAEKESFDFAVRAARFTIGRQNRDGSWPYSENRPQRWIDNFHTGYNLVALKKFSQCTGNESVVDNIQRGFQFYRKNFFTANGLPKYYHNRMYPIDIQVVSTLLCKILMSQFLKEGEILSHFSYRVGPPM